MSFGKYAIGFFSPGNLRILGAAGSGTAIACLLFLGIRPLSTEPGGSEKPTIAVIGTPEIARQTVEAALTRAQCCIIVDATAREKVLNEQKFSQSGLANDKGMAQIGQLMSASRIAVVQAEGGSILLRVIDVQTGRVIVSFPPFPGAAEAGRSLTEAMEGGFALQQLASMDLSKGKIRCSLILDKQELKVKENLTGTISCVEPAYITLLLFAASGEVSVLLPMKNGQPARIEGGKDYTFPREVFGPRFVIEAIPPYGKDRLVMFATRTPEGLADFGLLDKENSARGKRSATFTRGAIAKLKALTAEDWGAADVCFETYEGTSRNDCPP